MVFKGIISKSWLPREDPNIDFNEISVGRKGMCVKLDLSVPFPYQIGI